jgi:hypothetical protein
MGLFLISNQDPRLGNKKKSYKFALDNTKVSKILRQSKFFIDQQTPLDWPKSEVFRGVYFAF